MDSTPMIATCHKRQHPECYEDDGITPARNPNYDRENPHPRSGDLDACTPRIEEGVVATPERLPEPPVLDLPDMLESL